MPLYEYECKACHQRTEKIQSFNAPPETVCPKCGGPLERLISPPALQFKGAGWYVNDYAKASAASPSSTAKEKSESAPAATGESSSTPSSKGSDTAAPASPAPASTTSSGS